MRSALSLWSVVVVLSAMAASVGAQSPEGAAGDPAAANGPFVPPPCSGGLFADVTCTTPFDAWIEQYALDGITAGCGGGNYCPGASVTRAQMAVFVEKAMRGTASWGPGDQGRDNTALGYQSLYSNTSAGLNTAVGSQALYSQSYDGGGSYNTYNTAVGWQALFLNQPSTGSNGWLNTAVGAAAALSNSTGSSNTSVGAFSFYTNLSGSRNTAVGYTALHGASTSNNTAVGHSSLYSATTGFDNTAIGWKAGARGGDAVTGYTGAPVTFVNTTTGSYNTFVGIAGSTADVSNCTAVGMDAYCDATDQVRLGNFFVSSIGGKVGWSTLSDQRAKTDIADLEVGLDLVMALRPVSFRYRGGNGRIDLGFIAQDVEAVLGDDFNVVDVGGDAERTLSLRYGDLVAPMVRAIQEQQAEIEELRAQLAQRDRQEARIAALERAVQELTARAPGAGAVP